ncbi:winged helix-turn-helix transcriptional regulator [Tumebacillus sp. ITR2]|uniref:Winged helix-turn-helix transcriptional regulator n=1 Tax=Tumebacillus amylolyticus TaxID=2801339 RepID=A0ABS1JFZ2_9BACL|nr:MarR family winged helix-turn-helix transcriptional regulator [Tumebacillus amylolyticus]MBL0389145.1 winged helix-turn-helix transcriptional regulator [Tumebacillus amylolyticus]
MENMRELFQIMTRRFGVLNKRCCTTADGVEVSLVQSHILHEISRQHEPSIQQVAETLGLEITTFSRQVQTLVDAGLVKKTPYANDRRIQILSLTEQGEYTATEIDKEINQYLNEIFSQMTDFEKQIVVHSIKLLNDSMSKSSMCCTPLG